MRTTSQLADYVHNTQYHDIAPPVVERTKDLCLSLFGAAVLGAQMDVTRITANYARQAGGQQEASVIGGRFRTSAELAGLVNSVSAHCTELEDVAFPEAMPTVNIIPAIIALGEKLPVPGQEILAAIVVAFEIAARPGTILSNAPGGLYGRGFQPGPQLAPAGVAAAAAKMLGLSCDQTKNAIAIAASFAGGLVRQAGSGAHVIEPGLAGRNGLTAAMFAQQGMTGEPAIMEGKGGFWDAIAGQPEVDFNLGTGADFRIMEVGLKRYPCCYFLQRIIDGVIAMMAEHRLTAGDIESVTVQGNEVFRTLIRQDEPRTGEEARFSLPHTVAAALTGDRVFAETFTTEAINNPRYRELWPKVRFARHKNWHGGVMDSDNPLILQLRNGTVLETSCVIHKGDPKYPLSRAEVIERFKTCAENYLSNGRMDAVIEMVYGMDHASDISALLATLSHGDLTAVSFHAA